MTQLERELFYLIQSVLVPKGPTPWVIRLRLAFCWLYVIVTTRYDVESNSYVHYCSDTNRALVGRDRIRRFLI